jgi:hypothetical protein
LVALFCKKIEVVFLFKKIEGVFHISSSWVKIRMHTKNQLHRLPGNTLNVMGPGVVVWWWWWSGGVVVWFILPIIIPHQPSCFVLFCVVG